MTFSLHDSICDPECKYLILIWDINNRPFTVVKTYAPNSHQIHFAQSLKSKMRISCNNFNLTANPHLDLSSKPKILPLALQPILQREDLYDTWRCQHAEEHDYTFHSLPHNLYSRIDMILVNKVLLQAVSSSTTHDMSWSDHAPISISIAEEHIPNPAYIWRVNSHVLNSPQNVSAITKHLQEFFSNELGYCFKSFYCMVCP